MKRTFNFFRMAAFCVAMLSTAAMISCEENSGNNKGDDENLPVTMTLTAEPAAEANKVEFTVTDAEGKNITKASTIKNVQTGAIVSSAAWTASAAGEYTFVATYKNEGQSNKVTITATEDPNSEKSIFRHVMVHDFTATWCSNCPAVVKTLKNYESQDPGRLVVVSVCGDGNCGLANPAGAQMFQDWKIASMPTVLFNYDRKTQGLTPAGLMGQVNSAIKDYPALCNLKATSSVTGNKAKIDVTVKFEQEGDFKIVCCLVEDKVYTAGTSPDGKYDHVLQSFQTERYGNVIEGVAVGEKTLSFEADLHSGAELEKCAFVVYVLHDEGEEVDGAWYEKFIVNNAINCPINGSVDYQYSMRFKLDIK